MPIVGPAFDALRMPTMNEAIISFMLLWLVASMWTNWILYKLCNDQHAELQRLWDKLGIKPVVPTSEEIIKANEHLPLSRVEDILDYQDNSKRRWS